MEAIGCGSGAGSFAGGEMDGSKSDARGQRALIQCLGESKGRALWEMAHGRDPPASSNDQRSSFSSHSNSTLWGSSSSSSGGGSGGGGSGRTAAAGSSNDVDNRMFERQVARKSVSSQASWGVRFDTNAQVCGQINQDRMMELLLIVQELPRFLS